MQINSEIEHLREVIIHRPELSLQRLTPANCHNYLFDDVLWVEKAEEEHEYFQKVLTDHGVKVYLLHNLLKETMAIKKAREWLLHEVTRRLHYKSFLAELLFDFLMQLKNDELANYLIGGLTWQEAALPSKGLVCDTLYPDDFILPPLPNHLFTRDTSCWVGKGVSINPMHWMVRRGETLNLAAIYKFHPKFAKADFEIWYDGSAGEYLPSVEGGDVLILSKDCVAIGLSERTTPAAIEALAKRLFAKKDKQQIIAVEIPKDRASMHLDTVMTMLNYDTFCIAFPCDTVRSWSIRPGVNKDELVVDEEKDLFKAIAKSLDQKALNLITPGGDAFTEKREQWTDASNLLALSPGVVIGYDRNVETNDKLKEEGIKVIPIPGSELGRGRGGARCMSCPILRSS
jgi:arginine deiminase